MKNAISPIGMILSLVVMVIVLLLVARAWTKVAPTAVQITSPSLQGLQQGDSETAEGEGSQRLPTLNEMRESTSQHAEELEKARQQIDQ